jgi:hypothetical protein
LSVGVAGFALVLQQSWLVSSQQAFPQQKW